MRIKKKSKRLYFLIILLFVSIILLTISKNSVGINSFLGDFYYSNHNYQKAEYYYEKAINAGNKNYKHREKYLNSLLKSELTIDVQEKLVKLANEEFQDVCSKRAKNYMEEYKLQLSEKLPENYIKNAPSGKDIIHWGKPVIAYYFSDTQLVPAYYKEEIKNAFEEWQSCGVLKFKEVLDSKDADILIKFKQNNVEIKEYGVKYVIAYTEHLTSDKILKKMIINFYDKNADNKNFSGNQVYNTALHEIFHALGYIGHSYDKNDIMYASKDSVSMMNNVRSKLSARDINTLKILYAIKPDITDTDLIKSKYVPSIVVGDDSAINRTKLIEAKNYIRNAPTLSGGYISMAETLMLQKRYSLSGKYLEKALDVAKTQEEKNMIYYNLAVIYYYTQIPELALNYLDKAEEIKGSEDIQRLRAEIYIQQKDYEKAISEYKKLISKYSQNIDYAISLANIYVKNKKYFKARKVLKEFIKNNPKEKNNERFKPYGILIW